MAVEIERKMIKSKIRMHYIHVHCTMYMPTEIQTHKYFWIMLFELFVSRVHAVSTVIKNG